jgi:kinesin family protein C1
VFCRIRPFHHEESYSSRNLFTLDESNVFLKVAETKRKQYKFDKVFDQFSTQGIESYQYLIKVEQII